MSTPIALRCLTDNPQRIVTGYLLFIALAELLTSFPPIAGLGLVLHAITQFMLIGGGIMLIALEYAILSSSSPFVGTLYCPPQPGARSG